ncbi:MAG: hypothetical protein M1511_09095 [Deltaproteobacteria bacterium]|nr:hypothetical protein [Deltaproteobacteria bacterium]
MTKVTNLWSWFQEGITGRKTKKGFANPGKDMPVIPSHKPMVSPGFSVVLINERRGPTQFDLTGRKLRIGVGLAVVIVLLSVFGMYSFVRGLVGHTSTVASGYKKGAARIADLQSKTQDKQNSLSNGSRDYLGSAGSGSLSDNTPSGTTESAVQESTAGSSKSSQESADKLEGDLSASLQQSPTAQERSASNNMTAALHTGSGAISSGPKSEAVNPDRGHSATTTGSIMNFNAQDVTVKPEGANSGTLSFRLIKDHPDMLFSGYLFVFVEMKDKKRETKIFVYPDKTRLGEGDLPSDFRQGENISFKYNSRVELPYGDIRSGSALARVSILLYGDDGKIVFQRGFEKKELLVSGASGPQRMEGAKSKPADKRRAL